MSSASSIRDALAAYVAGRVQAEPVVAAVAEAYYGKGGKGTGVGLRPLVDVIERAAPGVVELARTADRPGFAVTLAARPFPKEYEAALRRAAESYLEAGDVGRGKEEGVAAPGLVRRVLASVRRLFSAAR